jgi:hypothetical protein
MAMASDPKFHSSKLSFLSALNPPWCSPVTLFKSSLPATNPSQSLCLSLPLNSRTCDLTGSVCPPPNSSCQSSTSTSSPTPSSHDSDPPFPPWLALPNSHHPILLLQLSLLTLSYRLLRNQHCQPCPQPLLHPNPLYFILTLIYLNSRRWQELMALSEFMCPFP